jgi:hypothetical protein
VFFGALEIGGLSHVFLDSLDHWAVPILAPFSPREFQFDVDRIVNVGSMAFTVISYGILIDERGRVPVEIWALTTRVLLALVTLYFAIRILARWRAGAAARRHGYSAVIPQGNPLVFRFFAEERTGERLQLRTALYHLLGDSLGSTRTLELSTNPSSSLPVTDAAGALARSYAPALAASWTLGETHHFAEVGIVPGGFAIFWYSLEFNFGGRSAGVETRVDSITGAVVTHNRWRRPSPSTVATGHAL